MCMTFFVMTFMHAPCVNFVFERREAGHKQTHLVDKRRIALKAAMRRLKAEEIAAATKKSISVWEQRAERTVVAVQRACEALMVHAESLAHGLKDVVGVGALVPGRPRR